MNERIKELAKQAMTATTNKFSADREWSADEWRDFYDTKFAELIVRECINAVGNDPMAQPYIQNIKAAFGVEYYESIDKAFGANNE